VTEIERKFRLRFMPEEISGHSSIIEQGYLFSDGVEFRLRKEDESGCSTYSQTVKGEGDIERDEWGNEIPEWVFDLLWSKVQYSLRKIRVRVPYGKYLLDVDTYLDALDGLLTFECEFSTMEEADAFQAPPWAAGSMEVTYDPRYKNKNLSQLRDLSELDQ
jgi:CYTH domain-containing protein